LRGISFSQKNAEEDAEAGTALELSILGLSIKKAGRKKQLNSSTIQLPLSKCKAKHPQSVN